LSNTGKLLIIKAIIFMSSKAYQNSRIQTGASKGPVEWSSDKIPPLVSIHIPKDTKRIIDMD